MSQGLIAWEFVPFCWYLGQLDSSLPQIHKQTFSLFYRRIQIEQYSYYRFVEFSNAHNGD